ncbi:MAG: hypothetical protein ACNS62_21285 [Candidatus Cyclobacteriaceae bacterium M3_2C_046]
MEQQKLINDTIQLLQDKKSSIPDFQVFTGFDGYVDKIQRVVKARKKEEFEAFPTIQELSLKIGEAAGKSAQFELVTQELKLGGNAPIMANALGGLGLKNVCMAALGFPEVLPVFDHMHPNARKISISNPGLTNALEFDDGKLILSEVTSLNQITWESIKKNVGMEQLITSAQADLMALVDWSNLNHCTEIWQGMFQDIIPNLSKKPEIYFFDICDPSKKQKEDLENLIHLLSQYRIHGRVILGINENEANLMHRIIFERDDFKTTLLSKGREIFNYLNIDLLLIHPVDRALAFTSQSELEVKGKVVARPKISTGGGDNFNAGFCLGLLLSGSTEQCLLLGIATSGSYVKNGKSPSPDDLIYYLKEL